MPSWSATLANSNQSSPSPGPGRNACLDASRSTRSGPPQCASVQTVADRLNRYGTWLMFEVSNRIAYDDMMVNGVHRTDEFPLLGGSRWLDIAASPGKVKWNQAEGRYALKTLDLIAGRIREQMEKELAEAASEQIPKWADDQQKIDAEARRRLTQAVFVVSSFQDVVRPLATMIGDRLDRRAKRVGTVHTTQGKEADVVLLVLGTGADQGGSRDWAGKTPNCSTSP